MENQLYILENGEIQLEGRFLWGSNYTLFVNVTLGDQTIPAVYKPVQGERPLWDFPPDTLAFREAAAYMVSAALGWELVPPTVFRTEGPMGPGSLQLFIEHDPEYHYFNFTPEDRDRVLPIIALDVIINNADRKGGHLVVGKDNHMWAIDHGICFHHQLKLRTILWDHAGKAIGDSICQDIQTFADKKLAKGSELVQVLETYLTKREILALRQRTHSLLAAQVFPSPPENSRPYPWPLV